jgi:hypothetical protein
MEGFHAISNRWSVISKLLLSAAEKLQPPAVQ